MGLYHQESNRDQSANNVYKMWLLLIVDLNEEGFIQLFQQYLC